MARKTSPLRPLQESLGYLFRDTHRLISRRLQERLDRHGIGLGQWYLLRVLWTQDRLSQRELALRVGMGEPNAVTALNALERAGLVRRETDIADGRRKLIALTPLGEQLGPKLAPIADEVNSVISAPLTAEERAQLISLIQRVRESLQQAAEA